MASIATTVAFVSICIDDRCVCAFFSMGLLLSQATVGKGFTKRDALMIKSPAKHADLHIRQGEIVALQKFPVIKVGEEKNLLCKKILHMYPVTSCIYS